MTTAQWLFEYKALHAKETQSLERQAETTRVQFQALRDLLIGVLGLNLMGPKSKIEREQDEAAGLDPDTPKFVPASILMGQPEVIKHFLDKAKQETPNAEDSTMSDDAFEKFSSELHKHLKGEESDLDGDMIPLLTADLKDLEQNSYWRSGAAQQALQHLGVKQRPASQSTVAVHLEVKPKVFEGREGSMFSDEALIAMGEKPRDPNAPEQDPKLRESELEKYRRALAGEEVDI